MFGLFLNQTVTAIGAALDAAGVEGRVVVLDQPKLGKLLGERGYDVLHVARKLRSLRRGTGDRLYAGAEALPLAERSVGGVVAVGVSDEKEWSSRLGELSRVVADGGSVVLVDRAAATEASRRALCGGLVEIQQRHAGRTVVTSGLVTRAFEGDRIA